MKNFKSGVFLKTPNGYHAFQPDLINRAYHLGNTDLLLLLEKATRLLGELSAYSELVTDVRHFIQLHVVKEATTSSRIEGTQTNLEEALMLADDILPERRNDWQEVTNYINAMNFALRSLETLPLSSRLFRQTHQVLLEGVRGENKLPGEFRRSQNWIGGAALADATFIPPVWTAVETLMGDLENFLHNPDTKLPHLLKIALAHYQFETIHPFLDGNGRIGRLMIGLYLNENKILRQPVLYLSEFFERNKFLYYENLMRVRLENDLQQWFKFFLVGIIETAEKSIQGLRNILALKSDIEKNRLPTIGKRAVKGLILLEYLFSKPIVRAEEVANLLKISSVSAYKLIQDFEQLGILKENTGGQRNRYYIFEAYFKIFD